MIKIDKIQLQNFRFFTDDEKHSIFEIGGKNTLIYGENGSGKSSIYKAFEFLTKPAITQEEFYNSRNIFQSGDTFLEFDFSNAQTLRIDEDHLSLDGDYEFVEKLSVSKPILDYKHLLNVSYTQASQIEEKNLFSFFKKILEEYPIGEEGKKLKDLVDEEHFEHFKRIIQEELFDDINLFLEKFQQNFKITTISLSVFGKAYLKIEYFGEDISEHKFHLFLNEARLSALAMSVYFAIIKKQFSYLQKESLKILVLDDLLISLDMNNRMRLVEILKTEFSDFQIFFFTHDKGLFEIIKDKMEWRAFEIYVDKHSDGYEIPFVKKSNSLIEQARLQKHLKNYDCCANLLRQCTEKLLCKFLPPEKLVNKNCKELDLNGLIQNAIAFEKTNQAIIDNVTKLQTYRRIILNSGSHYNNVIIYKRELAEVIEIIEKLENDLNSLEQPLKKIEPLV